MKMEEEEKKKEKRSKIWYIILTLIIVLLILIILWLLLRKDKKEMVPTGNTDIFEINCDCEFPDQTEQEEEDNITGGEEQNSTGGQSGVISGNEEGNNVGGNGTTDGNEEDIPTTPETPEIPDLGGDYELIVRDDDIIWESTNELRIFANPVYGGDSIIAPGSSNSYHFVVKNNSSCSLSYELNFIEENPYQINMKYRIKKNGEYLNENYVSYEKLNIAATLLSSGDQDEFYLEWIWEESNNDTSIGASEGANYKLQLEILGMQG